MSIHDLLATDQFQELNKEKGWELIPDDRKGIGHFKGTNPKLSTGVKNRLDKNDIAIIKTIIAVKAKEVENTIGYSNALFHIQKLKSHITNAIICCIDVDALSEYGTIMVHDEQLRKQVQDRMSDDYTIIFEDENPEEVKYLEELFEKK